MRGLYVITAVMALSAALSCNKMPDVPIRRENVDLTRGKIDSLTYRSYIPLQNKPVKVYYYIPEAGDTKTMKVLFAMHGADRNGIYQAQNWKDVAEDKGVIVIAPLFTKELYPVLDYQYGGVSLSSTGYVARDKSLWTYNIIESLFDYFKEKTGNRSEKYDLWGHSAGGQFSHRMPLFMPYARYDRIVCSNSGFYTIPDLKGLKGGSNTYVFPYSIKGTDVTEEDLKKYFSLNLTVHVGTADVATTAAEDSSLPVTAGAKAQGACRFDRGHFFYDYAERLAKEMNTPFNWKIVEVPGVPHSSRRMIQTGVTGAATLLYYSN